MTPAKISGKITKGVLLMKRLTKQLVARLQKLAKRIGKKRLIFGAVVLVYLIGLVVIYSPGLRNRVAMSRASNTTSEFMTAITSGDVDRALSFVKADDSVAARAFIDSTSKVVQGSYQKQSSKIQGQTVYVLYSLSHEKNKHARVATIKTDEGWKVTSFVVSENEIPAVPAVKQNEQ